MGHGAGEKCIGRKQLDLAHNLETIVMLMGCGSAKLLLIDKLHHRRRNIEGIIADYTSSDVCVNKNLFYWKLMVCN